MIVTVETGAGLLHGPAGAVACRIGRAGTVAEAAKREGDGCTPLGDWPVRTVLFRPDRVARPSLRLPWRWIRPEDGWSDDPRDPAYNRPVRLPHRYSAEALWREDGAYDVFLVIGHNDSPPRPGAGSAIFVHCPTVSGFTQGCVALPRPALLDLVAGLAPGDRIAIR